MMVRYGEDGISRVAVFGTGQMGPGIAVVTTLASCPTSLIGRSAESAARGQKNFEAALDFLVTHEAVVPDQATAARARLSVTHERQVAAQADLVIESIVEHLPTKQAFFRDLDELCPQHTILASDTSGLRISDIAARMSRPERAVTTHFWNPSHLMPLVEVIQGQHTSEETVQRVYHFLTRCGKRPVIGRRDLPGQICGRLFQAMIREAIYMVQEGITTAEGVDTAIKAGVGARLPVYGSLEHLDAVGLDVGVAVQASVLPSLCNSTEPLPLLRDLAAAGNMGARTGQGFYDWQARSVDDLRRERDVFLVERIKFKRASSPA